MTISIIFTGGTIGSLTKKEWVGIDEATNFMLLDKFDKQFSDIKFVTSSPYSILSENLSATELNILQQKIASELECNPDGIIVTHGTDTLQYAAAAIEFAFADAGVPIIFVSADYPLDNPATNGYINFEAAVEFIKTKHKGGVFVAYKNESSDTVKIRIASRLLQHSENSANIHGIKDSVVAEYKDGEFTMHSVVLSRNVNPLGVIEYAKYSQILTVESMPGSSYAYALDNVKAIIIKPYHSATLDTVSEGLIDLCKRAEDLDIPIFVAGVKTGISYESSKLFASLNIRVAPYSTYVTLYMKLWAAISRGTDTIDCVNSHIANELM